MNTNLIRIFATGLALTALAAAVACRGNGGEVGDTAATAFVTSSPPPEVTASPTTDAQQISSAPSSTSPQSESSGGAPTAGQAAAGSGVQTTGQGPTGNGAQKSVATGTPVPAVTWQRLSSPYGGFEIMAPQGWNLAPVADDESTVEVVSPDHARTELSFLWSKVADFYVTGNFDPLDYSKQWGAEEFLSERLLPIEQRTDPSARILSENVVSPASLEFSMAITIDGSPLVAKATLEMVNSPFDEMTVLVGTPQFMSTAVVTWCAAPGELLPQIETLCPRILLSFTPNANWGAAGAQNSQLIAQFGANMRSAQYQEFQSTSEWRAYNGRMLTNALGGTTDYKDANGNAYTGLMNDFAPYHFVKAGTLYPSNVDPASLGEVPAYPCTWPNC